MSTPEIVSKLLSGAATAEVFNFTIRPGENTVTIKKHLKELGYTDEAITTAFTKQYDFPMLSEANGSLEGYLFGETIEFYVGSSVETILTAFLKLTQTTIDKNDLATQYAAQGLTLHQGIILASMVQKESYPADQPTVAQVFLSRYKAGWKLGSDVTASYAVDLVDPERHTYTNNYLVLNIDSCYNTRKYSGLPCGPIASPSLSALLAVAHPSDTNYMYFLTGDDNKMYYGYTESDHNRNIRNYCKKLCNAAL